MALYAPVRAQSFLLPPQLYGRPGQVVYVDIWGDSNIRRLTGVHFVLNYGNKAPQDAPPLTAAIQNPKNAVEIQVGTLIPPKPLAALDIRPQEISIALILLTATRWGDGPGWILSLPLQIPPNAPPGATYSLALTRHDALGTDDKIFPTEATTGQLTVDPNTPILGDVNGDGKVNVIDANLALRIIIRMVEPTPGQFYAADFFPKDGVVNVVDVVGLLRHITQQEQNTSSVIWVDGDLNSDLLSLQSSASSL